jgi:hypothetical protein
MKPFLQGGRRGARERGHALFAPFRRKSHVRVSKCGVHLNVLELLILGVRDEHTRTISATTIRATD